MEKDKNKSTRKSDINRLTQEILQKSNRELSEQSFKDTQHLIGELQTYQIELEMQNEELRKTQIELEESRNKYSELYDFAPIGYISFDKKGLIVEINLTGAEMLGLERSRLINRPFLFFIAEDSKNIFYSHQNNILKTKTKQICELKLLKKDGSQFYALLESIAVLDDKGNTILWRTALSDHTSHKRAEEGIRIERDNLEMITKYIGAGLIMISKDFKTIWANKVIKEKFGEVDDKICYMVYNQRTEVCQSCGIRKIFESGEDRVVHEQVGKDRHGNEVWSEIIATPVRDNEGNIIGALELVIPTTERKRMEKELLKIQKLESLGILAGGIAHDFNNIMTGILGNIALAKIDANPKKEIFMKLNEAESAIMRAMNLTQRLITFAKGGAPVIKPVAVEELLKESVGFALSGSKTKCDYSLAGSLWKVDVDEGQIQQAINNLVLNAVQSMREGGLINVSAENIVVKNEDNILCKPGAYVRISIKDEGIGIHEENLDKIFDPYFTTKSNSNGLGLAAVYSIIKNHEGYITVNSNAGEGSTFTLYLPASKNEMEEKIGIPETIINGEGRILIMDDEEIIRSIAGEILNRSGYEVGFARDGAEAIDLYKQAHEWGRPFNLVLMDLTIPGGMGGKETIKELLRLYPDVTAIVSSGYSNDPIMTEYKKYGFKGVLKKPYKFGDLVNIIHDAIGHA